MSSQGYRPVSEMDFDDLPNLTPLPEEPLSNSPSGSYFENITLQTWIIILLLLAFLGINIFAYLAKGTQETVSIFSNIFEPIFKFFGYTTLATTKQTIETSATGATTGINMVAGTTTDAIDNIIQTPVATSGTSTGVSSNVPQGNISTSLPVQNNIQKNNTKIEKWREDALSKALESAEQKQSQVSPDDSRSSIQTTGKSGWCYIGDDQGLRTCSEIGVNDVCMSGDVFPSQSVCINPKLRA